VNTLLLVGLIYNLVLAATWAFLPSDRFDVLFGKYSALKRRLLRISGCTILVSSSFLLVTRVLGLDL